MRSADARMACFDCDNYKITISDEAANSIGRLMTSVVTEPDAILRKAVSRSVGHERT